MLELCLHTHVVPLCILCRRSPAPNQIDDEVCTRLQRRCQLVAPLCSDYHHNSMQDDLLCLVHHPPAFQLLGRHLYQTVIMCRNHPARRLHPTQEGITAAAFSLDTIPLQGCLRLAMVWHQATLKLTSGL
ncbi:TPA: hypothetical protein ACH3X3_014077 [Trebouxia sp. C0006]